VPATPERLRAALADLPLVIEAARVASRAVPVPSYGGPRPTSVVTLAGGGHEGCGEHVGWSDAAHAAFAGRVHALPRGAWRLGDWSRLLADGLAEPYDRAALEAAAIALALRQRGTTLGSLAGVVPRAVRHVVSFARTDDPAAEAARHPGVELKPDADPAWSDATWAALARAGRVAVVDWKGGGDAAAYARACRALPGALHEDPAPPWPEAVARAVSLDAPVTSAAALDGHAPVACNLKPARMGGVLAMLEAAARCAERGIAPYLGGMFEVDVGRGQLRALAAVLCPDGPNDVAPVPLAEASPKP
jgi:hypothetical protein